MTDTANPREMALVRVIAAPPEAVWEAWDDPQVLPRWFGPEGHSCATRSIDLREGGAWVFEMIGPDGTVYPNRHRFTLRQKPERIEFIMDDGAGNMPKTARATFEAVEGGTRVSLVLTFATAEEREAARGFGADRLGLTTLAKLAAIVEKR